MATINTYMDDGAGAQARAVLAFLSDFYIQESWNGERYKAEVDVERWNNGRERGYVLMLRSDDFRQQLNIAFFEHRNSDQICAVMWEQKTMNAPTIDTADFGAVYKDKSDVSFEVNYGQVRKMADWIEKELTKFWKNSQKRIDREDRAA